MKYEDIRPLICRLEDEVRNPLTVIGLVVQDIEKKHEKNIRLQENMKIISDHLERTVSAFGNFDQSVKASFKHK